MGSTSREAAARLTDMDTGHAGPSISVPEVGADEALVEELAEEELTSEDDSEESEEETSDGDDAASDDSEADSSEAESAEEATDESEVLEEELTEEEIAEAEALAAAAAGGHIGPPTAIITGSMDVFINGLPAARLGDILAPHHPGIRTICEGTTTVLINGQPASRVTDAVDCGGTIATGSDNVFIGDQPVLAAPSDASLPDIVFNQHRRKAKQTANTTSTPANYDDPTIGPVYVGVNPGDLLPPSPLIQAPGPSRYSAEVEDSYASLLLLGVDWVSKDYLKEYHRQRNRLTGQITQLKNTKYKYRGLSQEIADRKREIAELDYKLAAKADQVGLKTSTPILNLMGTGAVAKAGASGFSSIAQGVGKKGISPNAVFSDAVRADRAVNVSHKGIRAPNLNENGTLSNLRPQDPSVLQKPARNLVQDDNGRYWLQNANGSRITPSGNYDFVTLPDGTVRIARPNTNPDFSTHLGLSGGGEVNYAGSIRFGNNSSPNRGTITHWSNDSGHYQPPAGLAENATLPLDLFKKH